MRGRRRKVQGNVRFSPAGTVVVGERASEEERKSRGYSARPSRTSALADSRRDKAGGAEEGGARREREREYKICFLGRLNSGGRLRLFPESGEREGDVEWKQLNRGTDPLNQRTGYCRPCSATVP